MVCAGAVMYFYPMCDRQGCQGSNCEMEGFYCTALRVATGDLAIHGTGRLAWAGDRTYHA